MIGQNDLYDMTAVFKRIREDVQYPHNIIILQKVIDVLNTQNIYKANQIRNSIAEIPGLDQKKWYFVFHQNLYVHEILLKDSRIVNLLKKICEDLIMAIKSCKYEYAKDLADMVHCLPDIIAENNLNIPRSYWRSHVQPFRARWNHNYLKNEQRSIS